MGNHFNIIRPKTTTVQLTRTAAPITPDVALWVAIRHSCAALEFKNYKRFIDDVMSAGSMQRRELKGGQDPQLDAEVIADYDAAVGDEPQRVSRGSPTFSLLPFSNSDRYALLKAATEVFVRAKCGVDLGQVNFARLIADVSADPELAGNGIDFALVTPSLWQSYLDKTAIKGDSIIPYYGLILDKLKDVPV
ncbi:MAG TPA: hypothetical protein VFT22_27675, partial [Kofleriaceae bacterium]|nr:hypothetical protein [Kofleriaceae bacterium]